MSTPCKFSYRYRLCGAPEEKHHEEVTSCVNWVAWSGDAPCFGVHDHDFVGDTAAPPKEEPTVLPHPKRECSDPMCWCHSAPKLSDDARFIMTIGDLKSVEEWVYKSIRPDIHKQKAVGVRYAFELLREELARRAQIEARTS